MATSQEKPIDNNNDKTESAITSKLKDCKIADNHPTTSKKRRTSSKPQPGSSSTKEEKAQISVGVNPFNPSQLLLEIDGLDSLELMDSSEWETEDDDSDLEIDIIIQLKITLRDINPPIWRIIQVSSSDTFEDLHYYIQQAMGWKSCHAHLFKHKDKKLLSDTSYDFYKDVGDTNLVKESSFCLRQVFRAFGDKVLYEYDFGDSWKHDVEFQKYVLIPEKADVFPKCIAGQRACPPEDCGGADGYLHLLEVRNNPEHEEYEDLIGNWLGKSYPGFDPEVFDEKAVFAN